MWQRRCSIGGRLEVLCRSEVKNSPSSEGVARSDGVVAPDFDLFPTLEKGG
jgi:hypothetical protein